MAIRSDSAVLDNSGLKEDGLEKGEEAGRGGICQALGALIPFGPSWVTFSEQLLPTAKGGPWVRMGWVSSLWLSFRKSIMEFSLFRVEYHVLGYCSSFSLEKCTATSLRALRFI